MTAPYWKTVLQASLKENIEKSGLSATYASISTVRNDNTPAVRTVVMRGFAGEQHSDNIGWSSDLLVVITDKRSDKVKEIQKNPNTEINWFMSGTMEQFRIRGTVTVVPKDFNETVAENLNSHLQKTRESANTHKSLGLQMFLKQSKTNNFSWQGERLRHFYQFGAEMRKDMTESKEKDLEITEIDEETGWFKNNHLQSLLEEAFDNFVLLVINVSSVNHWSPSTGAKSML